MCVWPPSACVPCRAKVILLPWIFVYTRKKIAADKRQENSGPSISFGRSTPYHMICHEHDTNFNDTLKNILPEDRRTWKTVFEE